MDVGLDIADWLGRVRELVERVEAMRTGWEKEVRDLEPPIVYHSAMSARSLVAVFPSHKGLMVGRDGSPVR